MSEENNNPKRERFVKHFEPGQIFRIVDYSSDKSYDMKIISRKGRWVTVLLDGVTMNVRVYPVSNPLSESILLDNYSPVFSYQALQEQDNEQ